MGANNNRLSHISQNLRESSSAKANKKKGFTPNNRYKQDEESPIKQNLSLSNIMMNNNIDFNSSEIMNIDELFDHPIVTPMVATINLYPS